MDSSQSFRQRYDRRTRWVTAVVICVSIGALVYLAFTSSGTYLPGWFALTVVAVLALAALSIPRYVLLTSRSMELHCLVRIEVVAMREIKRVRVLLADDMRWAVPVPLFGVFGVFGYYGYYVDLRRRKLFKLYARGWNNFVMIEDVYEEVMVLGVADADAFVRAVAPLLSSSSSYAATSVSTPTSASKSVDEG